MLRIIHSICCGMDVHKKFVVATIASTDSKNVTTYLKHRFNTFNSDLKSLETWLLSNNCTEVCMESTGKYWIPIFNVLEKSCHVVVANPKYLHSISIIGYELSSDQSAKMGVCRNHFDYINVCIDTIDSNIDVLAQPFQDLINLVVTVPGIKEQSAKFIIAEIVDDMSVFHSSKHLCSWAGLTPQNNESAGKKKSVHVSRAGVYLKPLLVQCANAAIKDKKNPYFKFKYDCIKKRRGHKRAIIAIARMILTCLYHMFLKKETFNPSDTDYSNIPEVLYEKHKQQYYQNDLIVMDQ